MDDNPIVNGRQTDDKQTINDSEVQKKSLIIDLLRKQGEARVSTLSKLVGISTSQVKRYIYQLLSEGTVVAHGANKNRTYSLK